MEEALSEVQSTKPVILRLSAEAQIDDKLAMREMARQLVEQTGSSYALPEDDMADDHNDALMSAETVRKCSSLMSLSLISMNLDTDNPFTSVNCYLDDAVKTSSCCSGSF